MEDNNGKPITTNELAGMIKSGFDDATQRLSSLQSDVSMVKSDVGILKSDVGTLKTDMEEVKMRLDHKAYQFDIDDLKKRVVVLEKNARVG